jgi:hypothetical protein
LTGISLPNWQFGSGKHCQQQENHHLKQAHILKQRDGLPLAKHVFEIQSGDRQWLTGA